MSLNIKTDTGLLEIGGKVTQEKIESALGYIPAKPEDLSAHIEDNSVHLSEDEKFFVENKDYYSLNNRPNIQESGNDDEFVIVDKNDIPIFKVDKDGLTTAAIHLNDIEYDVAEEINNLKQTSLKNIIDDESEEFIVVDKNDIPIFKIDKDGVTTTDVVTNTGSINDHIEDINIHVSLEDKEKWNNKLDSSSLEPINTSIGNIQNEINKFDFIDTGNDNEFVIKDENDKVAFRVDEEGVTQAATFISNSISSNSLLVDGTDVNAELIELNDNIDTLNGDVTKVGSVSKKIADAISAENLSQYAKSDDLNKHINESDNRTTKLHISKEERDSWNAKSEFSGDYNDLDNAPNITENGSGDLVISDPQGNIIFRSDGAGFETTTITAQSMMLNGNDVGDILDTYILNVDNSDLEFDPSEIVGGGAAGDGGGSVVGGVSSWNDLLDKPFYDNRGTAILEEQEYNFNIPSSENGINVMSTFITPNESFNLVPDAIYIITFDDIDYECRCYSYPLENTETYILGNIHRFLAHRGYDNSEFEETNEPFVFAYRSSDGNNTLVSGAFDETVTSIHSFAISNALKQLDSKYVDMRWDNIIDKPFYDNSSYETFLEANSYSFRLESSGLMFWGTPIDISNFTPVSKDENYIITFDGVAYECVSFEANLGGTTGIGVGNRALLGLGENTGEPFVLGTDNATQLICFTPTGDSHTIGIEKYIKDIKTLDEKYLPKDAIIAMIDAYIEEALGGDY